MSTAYPDFETADDRRTIATPGLRLTFRWAADRWTHALEVGPEPGRVVLAESVEGDAGRDDPARVVSPAYQQFHWRRGEADVQAMLLGQSGPHHFSAVFSVRGGPGGARVEVDVADRCRAEVVAMACTYLVHAPSGDLVEADPARIVWEDAAGGRLTFSATGPARAGLAEAGRRAARVQAQAEIVPGLHTRRCLYQWEWSGRPDDH